MKRIGGPLECPEDMDEPEYVCLVFEPYCWHVRARFLTQEL